MRLAAVVLSLAVAGAALAQGMGFGGGGAMGGVLLLQFSQLNPALETAGFPTLAGGLTLAGGSGVGGTTGVVAFGGMGFGGSLEAREGERAVKLEIGYGGFVVEHPWQLGKAAILSLGTAIGGGGATLTLRFREANDFGDALASPTVTQLETGFFALLPHLRLTLPLGWLLLDGWAGYFLPLPGPWTEGATELEETPELSGAFFALEVVFGGMEPEVVQTPSY